MKNIKIYESKELRDLRKSLKLSQGDLAVIMGMSKKNYVQIMRYEKDEIDIVSYHAWEKLQDYVNDKS